jgi:hypothetical protein
MLVGGGSSSDDQDDDDETDTAATTTGVNGSGDQTSNQKENNNQSCCQQQRQQQLMVAEAIRTIPNTHGSIIQTILTEGRLENRGGESVVLACCLWLLSGCDAPSFSNFYHNLYFNTFIDEL